jgi:hypothetical protein
MRRLVAEGSHKRLLTKAPVPWREWPRRERGDPRQLLLPFIAVKIMGEDAE